MVIVTVRFSAIALLLAPRGCRCVIIMLNRLAGIVTHIFSVVPEYPASMNERGQSRNAVKIRQDAASLA